MIAGVQLGAQPDYANPGAVEYVARAIQQRGSSTAAKWNEISEHARNGYRQQARVALIAYAEYARILTGRN